MGLMRARPPRPMKNVLSLTPVMSASSGETLCTHSGTAYRATWSSIWREIVAPIDGA